MMSVFWDRKGILLVDFMPPGATINAAAYCYTLTRLRRAIVLLVLFVLLVLL